MLLGTIYGGGYLASITTHNCFFNIEFDDDLLCLWYDGGINKIMWANHVFVGCWYYFYTTSACPLTPGRLWIIWSCVLSSTVVRCAFGLVAYIIHEMLQLVVMQHCPTVPAGPAGRPVRWFPNCIVDQHHPMISESVVS